MERICLLEEKGDTKRIVVLEDGQPVELLYEPSGSPSTVGNLYMGRVINVVRGMHAAFVDIGTGKNAFLPLDDVPSVLRDAKDAVPAKKALPVRQGDEVLVQVLRDPIGDKGARVSMHPTMPGKYAVLLPLTPVVGVSRHIEASDRRSALHDLACTIRGMFATDAGLVIRTAAESAVPDDAIAADAQELFAQWQVLSSRANATRAPALIKSGGGLLERAVRDLDAELVRGDIPIAIDNTLEKILRRRVWLKSGAYLVIDPCEAMTVIDVNSGKFTGKKNLAETLLHVNLEAAREIARQIRLRDMGGIIVMDFVDMQEDADREAVLSAFMEALSPDRAKRHVHGFSAAGLLEMTRRAVYKPVREALYKPCEACHGEGVIRI